MLPHSFLHFVCSTAFLNSLTCFRQARYAHRKYFSLHETNIYMIMHFKGMLPPTYSQIDFCNAFSTNLLLTSNKRKLTVIYQKPQRKCHVATYLKIPVATFVFTSRLRNFSQIIISLMKK